MTDTVPRMHEFFNTVVNNLNVVHIGMLAMCIYDEPIFLSPQDDFEMPEKARLFWLIDNDSKTKENYYEKGGIEFSPKEDSSWPAGELCNWKLLCTSDFPSK